MLSGGPCVFGAFNVWAVALCVIAYGICMVFCPIFYFIWEVTHSFWLVSHRDGSMSTLCDLLSHCHYHWNRVGTGTVLLMATDLFVRRVAPWLELVMRMMRILYYL